MKLEKSKVLRGSDHDKWAVKGTSQETEYASRLIIQGIGGPCTECFLTSIYKPTGQRLTFFI
jgi:hypothetical protein